MSYQRCPICEGHGVIPSRPSYATEVTWVSGNVTETCPTCFGHRIIDTQSGRPPVVSRLNIINVEPEQSQSEGDGE